MFDWLGDILSGMGDAVSSTFGSIGEQISKGRFVLIIVHVINGIELIGVMHKHLIKGEAVS